jgi:hypothetical protein
MIPAWSIRCPHCGAERGEACIGRSTAPNLRVYRIEAFVHPERRVYWEAIAARMREAAQRMRPNPDAGAR